MKGGHSSGPKIRAAQMRNGHPFRRYDAVKKPAPAATPTRCSWWLGLSRDEFSQAAKRHTFGPTNYSSMFDFTLSPAGRYREW